jgi:CubicO group peptidase (beta-lactamase class C family)
LFALASNSKLFTTLTLGGLIENGTRLEDGEVLTWDTKVSQVITDWATANGGALKEVTLKDLGSEWEMIIAAMISD